MKPQQATWPKWQMMMISKMLLTAMLLSSKANIPFRLNTILRKRVGSFHPIKEILGDRIQKYEYFNYHHTLIHYLLTLINLECITQYVTFHACTD
jgi:hypothetical protein